MLMIWESQGVSAKSSPSLSQCAAISSLRSSLALHMRNRFSKIISQIQLSSELVKSESETMIQCVVILYFRICHIFFVFIEFSKS